MATEKSIAAIKCPTALRLLMTTCLAVFLAETLVMLLLSLVRVEMPVLLRAMLDSTLLVAFMLPLLNRFLYRPLFKCINDTIEIQEDVIKEKCRLELSISRKSSELEKDLKECERKLEDARKEVEAG